MSSPQQFLLDGELVNYEDGDTIMDAALRAGRYIPHLCHEPGYTPHGSCRLCIVKINGHFDSACTRPASNELKVESQTADIRLKRKHLLQMLFVEGNHICPGCEKSGNCKLQALAYEHEMLTPDFVHFFENRKLDASHPDFIIDYNRCIVCELCVRASRDLDQKSIFITTGRGINRHLAVNNAANRLADSDFSASDAAAHICPVGAILKKHIGFEQPIDQRRYDHQTISRQDLKAQGNKDHD